MVPRVTRLPQKSPKQRPPRVPFVKCAALHRTFVYLSNAGVDVIGTCVHVDICTCVDGCGCRLNCGTSCWSEDAYLCFELFPESECTKYSNAIISCVMTCVDNAYEEAIRGAM